MPNPHLLYCVILLRTLVFICLWQEQNSVYDTPSEDDQWRQKIEEKKLRQGHIKSEAKPVSEITAWHEKKWERTQNYHLQSAPYELQRQKRRQPRDYNPETTEPKIASNPPPHSKVAEMARYIVHNSGMYTCGT